MAKELAEELNTNLKNIHAYISILRQKGIIIRICKIGRTALYGLKESKYHQLMHENDKLTNEIKKLKEKNKKYKAYINQLGRFLVSLIKNDLISDTIKTKLISSLKDK